MADATRAKVGAILGSLTGALLQLAEQHQWDVADVQGDLRTDPFSDVLLADGTRIRIVAEIIDVTQFPGGTP